MLDAWRRGGGQIFNLILDDGKSPKGLLCHFQCRYLACVSVAAALEMLSGAKLNFLPCHPPPPLSSFPTPTPLPLFF